MVTFKKYIRIKWLPVAKFRIWQMGNEGNSGTGWTRREYTHTKWSCGSVGWRSVPLWMYHWIWRTCTIIESVATHLLPFSRCVTTHAYTDWCGRYIRQQYLIGQPRIVMWIDRWKLDTVSSRGTLLPMKMWNSEGMCIVDKHSTPTLTIIIVCSTVLQQVLHALV
jgi:hypothetical protein